MFKTIGWPEIILFLVIIVLVFGVGRISKIAGEFGEAIRAFKDGLSGEKKSDGVSAEEDSHDEQD